MYCDNCGNKISNNSKFCSVCGTEINPTIRKTINNYNLNINSSITIDQIPDPIRKLSLRVKIESVLNLSVAIISSVIGIFIIYIIYLLIQLDEISSNNANAFDAFILLIVVPCLIIILSIITVINFKAYKKKQKYSKNILINPVGIVNTYAENKAVIKIILTIIVSIFTPIMAINLIPLIMSLINRSYVLNNAQLFNEIEEKQE